jgi:hypothetical protein
MLQMKQMETNFKVGDRIEARHWSGSRSGTIARIEKKKIYALLDTTTSGRLSEYSLRKDNFFVAVGYSMDDCFWGGFFHNI